MRGEIGCFLRVLRLLVDAKEEFLVYRLTFVPLLFFFPNFVEVMRRKTFVRSRLCHCTFYVPLFFFRVRVRVRRAVGRQSGREKFAVLEGLWHETITAA